MRLLACFIPTYNIITLVFTGSCSVISARLTLSVWIVCPQPSARPWAWFSTFHADTSYEYMLPVAYLCFTTDQDHVWRFNIRTLRAENCEKALTHTTLSSWLQCYNCVLILISNTNLKVHNEGRPVVTQLLLLIIIYKYKPGDFFHPVGWGFYQGVIRGFWHKTCPCCWDFCVFGTPKLQIPHIRWLLP